MKRRLAFTLLVLLILGAIINVAVAWGLYAFLQPMFVSHCYDSTVHTSWLRAHGWNPKPDHVLTCTSIERIGAARYYFDELPPAFIGPSKTIGFRAFYGWPLQSLEYSEFHVDPQGRFASLPWSKPMTISQNLVKAPAATNGTRSLAGSSYVVQLYGFPIRPRWDGFLLNTVFFGLLLLLIWQARRVVGYRSRRRLRTGLCPQCAYDLRENGEMRVRYLLNRGCPECGWKRTERELITDESLL